MSQKIPSVNNKNPCFPCLEKRKNQIPCAVVTLIFIWISLQVTLSGKEIF